LFSFELNIELFCNKNARIFIYCSPTHKAKINIFFSRYGYKVVLNKFSKNMFSTIFVLYFSTRNKVKIQSRNVIPRLLGVILFCP